MSRFSNLDEIRKLDLRKTDDSHPLISHTPPRGRPLGGVRLYPHGRACCISRDPALSFDEVCVGGRLLRLPPKFVIVMPNEAKRPLAGTCNA